MLSEDSLQRKSKPQTIPNLPFITQNTISNETTCNKTPNAIH